MAQSTRLARRNRTRRTLRMQILDDRRVLAAITGAVFDDTNDSLRRDSDEAGLVRRLVYVDQNDNQSLDAGEKYGLTDADGNFTIEGLLDGDHLVRVFNGTQSQTQTTPSEAEHNHDVVLQEDISVSVASFVHDLGQPTERAAAAVIAVDSTLRTIDATGAPGIPLDLGGTIIAMNRLASGELLVFSNTETGDRVWTISENLDAVNPFLDSDLGPKILSGGVDDVGVGVMVADDLVGGGEIWSVSDGSLTATSVAVPVDTVVTSDSSPRANDGPTRSLLSHTTEVDDGLGGLTNALAIDVWSNVDASLVTASPILVSGGLEVVAFSDEAGLVIVRGANDLTVHDLDNNLATLYSIADTGGAIDIDATRGLIVANTPRSFANADAGIRLLDQETGALIADLAIDLSAVGDLATVAVDAKLESALIAGTAGAAQVNLRRPAAHKVNIASGVASGNALFGMRMIGSNSGPVFASAPVLSTLEETALLRPAPALLSSASDAEDDQFVVVPIGDASVGEIAVTVDGGVTFVPPTDFEGPSEITVILTDGRDAVETILTVDVVGVPDAPAGITPLSPVPENVPQDGVIGVLDVIDVDLINDHLIEVSDPRFEVVNGELIFLGPGVLDFETEWSIPLIFTVDDQDAGTSNEYATSIEITDADDPITDITPDSANVLENNPGDVIKSLSVVDEDLDQFYEFSVDDSRFEVDFGELKLVEGVSLDREAAETIVVNVTATFGDDSFTKAITLTVLDAPETPANFVLSDATVLELEEGAEVGNLTIAGNPAVNGHSLTTNDSRFIFEGSMLRLADGVFVERTPGVDTEIQIEVTATPTLGGAAATETFVIVVLENQTPFHNADFPEDVNSDGDASALDALIIINYLNEFGPGTVGSGDPALGYDVNGDGSVTALDALLVINELNAGGGGTGAVNNEPNGEPTPNGEPISEVEIAEGDSNSDSPVAPAPSTQRVALNRTWSEPSSIDPAHKTNNKLVSSETSPSSQVTAVNLDDHQTSGSESDLADLVFSDDDLDLLS